MFSGHCEVEILAVFRFVYLLNQDGSCPAQDASCTALEESILGSMAAIIGKFSVSKNGILNNVNRRGGELNPTAMLLVHHDKT